MLTALHNYDVFPKVLRAGVETEITIEPLGRHAALTPAVIGSEQGGIRPVLILQNNTGNHFSPTVIAAAITSRRIGIS